MPVIPETPTIPQAEYDAATERWLEFIRQWVAYEQAEVGKKQFGINKPAAKPIKKSDHRRTEPMITEQPDPRI